MGLSRFESKPGPDKPDDKTLALQARAKPPLQDTSHSTARQLSKTDAHHTTPYHNLGSQMPLCQPAVRVQVSRIWEPLNPQT